MDELPRRKRIRLEEFDYPYCLKPGRADNIRPYGLYGGWFYEKMGIPAGGQAHLAEGFLRSWDSESAGL